MAGACPGHLNSRHGLSHFRDEKSQRCCCCGGGADGVSEIVGRLGPKPGSDGRRQTTTIARISTRIVTAAINRLRTKRRMARTGAPAASPKPRPSRAKPWAGFRTNRSDVPEKARKATREDPARASPASRAPPTVRSDAVRTAATLPSVTHRTAAERCSSSTGTISISTRRALRRKKPPVSTVTTAQRRFRPATSSLATQPSRAGTRPMSRPSCRTTTSRPSSASVSAVPVVSATQ